MAEPVSSISVVDVQIPFWRLVSFLLKLALAAIPASILFVIIVWGVIAVLRVVGLGLMVSSMRL